MYKFGKIVYVILIAFVSVHLVSCNKSESEVKDMAEQISSANESYNEHKLITKEDLMNTMTSNEINIQSRQSCGSQYPGGLPCPQHAREAYLRWHCYFVVWFYNPTPVNQQNMDTAYADYVRAHNYCY